MTTPKTYFPEQTDQAKAAVAERSFFPSDSAFAALRTLLASLDADVAAYPNMETMFPFCVIPNPHGRGLELVQIDRHGEPDSPYTGGYIKIYRGGEIAFVDADGDEVTAR